jgi:putative ABC transport system permease protein
VVAAEGASVTAFTAQTHSWIPRLLSTGSLAQIEAVEGVQEASPRVALQLDPEAFWMGVPTTIVGGYSVARLEEQTILAAGRYPTADEEGVVVLGADVARQLDSGIGDTVELRGRPFEVVGTLEQESITMFDQSAFISLGEARSLFVDSLEDMYRAELGSMPVITSVEVIAEDGVDADELARRIERDVSGVIAYGPARLKSESGGTSATYSSLAVSMGIISLVAGGLAVVNTMVVSATDRTREVGIKRALGASTGRIMRDVLLESAVLGVLGGLLGAAVGSIGVVLADAMLSASTGMGMFTLTPRLLLAAVTFATVIGLVGGAYPARYAAHLDPVDALAHR